MPPKSRYSKSEVVQAALGEVEENGLGSLTARSVAARLGSSTAPVYKHFVNMDQLEEAVVKETQRMMLEYTSRPYTDRVFLNMGTGVALFACEHKRLYRALMLEKDSYGHVVDEFLAILASEMTRDSRFSTLSESDRQVLLRKMWTFTHGLASMICVGLIKDCTRDHIINNLIDVGSDVIGSTLAKLGKTAKPTPPHN